MPISANPTPTRLLSAKAGVAAMALTAATALTVTLAAPSISSAARPATVTVAAVDTPRAVNAEVQLAAMIGVYGVGPVFQALRLAGVTDAEQLITNAVALLGQDGLSTAVETLFKVAKMVNPLDTRFVPSFGPAGVYDQVNSLDYSQGLFGPLEALKDGEFIQGMLAVIDGISDGAGTAVVNNLNTLVNQRRAILVSEHFGGTETAIALQQMIKDVENDSALWGDDKNGVTGVVAVMLRNTSRPGGGLLALVTPVSELFGVNMSNPDGGSYSNAGSNNGVATKVLNVSITDVGLKYDLLSDAPTTFNPLSWANSLAAVVMPTYLIPDQENILPAVGTVVPGLITGLANGGTVLLDPTGGQGVSLLTQGIPLVGGVGEFVDEIVGAVVSSASGFLPEGVELGTEGMATYVTYDSGNLPLLEPFQAIPRLLSYTGLANISTPFSSSFEQTLRTLVDIGYVDVVATEGANGVWSFTRTTDGIRDNAAIQADIFRLPEHLTWEQRFEIPQTVFNELLDGFQQNLLNPEAQRLTLLGNTALGDALYKNALVVAVAEALSQALEMIREPVNEMFNAGQDALKPVAQALDEVTKQVNGVIDQGRDSIKDLGIDVSGPLFDANRQLNNAVDPVIEQVQDSIADGIGSVVGGVTDQTAQKGIEEGASKPEEKSSSSSMQRTAVQDTKPDLESATFVPATDQKKDDEQKVARDTEQKEEPKTPPAVTVKEPTATESPSVPKSESTPQVGTDQGSKGQGTPASEGDSATKAPKKTFAEKRAEREAKQAEREAKREAKKAEREAKREAKQAEREAKREAKKAEREAKREAKQAEREAKREAKQAEREAKKAEREAKRDGGSGGASSGGNNDSGSSSGGGSDS